MLLLLPRIADYTGGYTMLGLGDIVLPGLLLTFVLRFDYRSGRSAAQGYFPLVCVGYAVGLLAALSAVYLMHGRGQPVSGVML